MSSFNLIRSVPDDIICSILTVGGVDDKITISTWKKALSFLWVCRKWRLVAEPVLLSVLICGNETYDGTISNYEFILQRRWFDNVKQIVVSDGYLSRDGYSAEVNNYPDNIDMMMNFGKLVGDKAAMQDIESLELVAHGGVFAHERSLRNADYFNDPDSDELDDDYFSDQFGNRVLHDKDELDSKCRDASTNIVSALAALCPNVTHLFFRFACPSIANEVLANMLADSYVKQLVKLECSIPVTDLKLKDGHNIQSLVLGDYDTQCGQLSQLPPNLVKNLSMSFEGAFSWDLFKRGDLAPTPYDNLTRLELCGPGIDINENADTMTVDSQSAENPPLVTFPVLGVLVIRHKILSFASLKLLLQFPVKVLRIDGTIKHAYQLYDHNLGNIDRLILKFDCNNFDDDNHFYSEFIQPSNKLFAITTANVSEVHLDIDLRFVMFDLVRINWIYLTHLYIELGTHVGQIFTAISKMPNLLSLSIFVHTFTKDIFNNVIEFIDKHGRDNTEPIKSKIKNVVVTCMYGDPSNELINALEFLKWYLPELEKLAVKKC